MLFAVISGQFVVSCQSALSAESPAPWYSLCIDSRCDLIRQVRIMVLKLPSPVGSVESYSESEVGVRSTCACVRLNVDSS